MSEHTLELVQEQPAETLKVLHDLARAILAGKLGFGDPPLNAFRRIPVEEKCELVSLTGHIQTRDGAPVVHLHAVVALKDGSTKAGHVFELRVAPIAEISVVATSVGGAH